jgi:hypothetical protein
LQALEMQVVVERSAVGQGHWGQAWLIA